jgi:hypothetical protein
VSPESPEPLSADAPESPPDDPLAVLLIWCTTVAV